ncbi:MAG: hypothetical protein HC908_04055 [Calothrix sp. SM1_7_51]|nr:hypothetical protein [Calothrix sp. SM1_7_51]
MYAQSNNSWDIEIYNHQRQLVLVGEVKCLLNTSPDWAVKFRRNILAHGIFPIAPYLMIIFPDKICLWTNENGVPEEREPDYIVDAYPIFQPDFEKAGTSARKISDGSFELIVDSWLANIMYLSEPSQASDESQKWLVDSGLYNTIKGGRFNDEAIA